MNKELRITIISLFLFLFVVALPASAQIVPCGGPGQAACTVTDLFRLLANVYNFFLGISALVAMLFLIVGGVQMMLGFLDAKGAFIEAGKSRVRNGIIGIVIVALAYIIVNTLLALLGAGSLPELFKSLGIDGIF